MIAADHLYFLLVALVHPVAGYFSFQRLLRRIAAGQRVNRPRLYGVTMVGHWLLLGIVLAIWMLADRSWATLGLGFDLDTDFAIGAILTALAVALFYGQLRGIAAADAGEIRRLHRQLGRVAAIVPHNRQELGRFYLLSLTAGVVEEVLWRGYLIWYLSAFMPLWLAGLLSAVGFGAAHAYQGIANLPRITAVGVAFVGLYLLSGSLWLPMVLHAAVDILQGRLACTVVSRAESFASGDEPG